MTTSPSPKTDAYREGRRSTFVDRGKTYWVDVLLAATRHKPVKRVQLSNPWIFPSFTEKEDLDRVNRALLQIPLVYIVIEIDGQEHYVALDGNHRLAKAKKNKKPWVLAREITQEELDRLPTV